MTIKRKETQKEEKKNKNMTSKSIDRDAITHWQSALAQTKQLSRNKHGTLRSRQRYTIKTGVTYIRSSI